MEPETEPGTLESSRSSYKDSFSSVKMKHDYEIIFFIFCSSSEESSGDCLSRVFP